MPFNETLVDLIRNAPLERFLEYVRVDTRSDPNSDTHPSTPGQLELAEILKSELSDLGIADVELDPDGYLYAVLPGQEHVAAPPITLCAHLDTSPSVSGEGVTPVLHSDYDGGAIRFPRDPELLLTPEDSPELTKFLGDSIITAAGDTLLGADDKAGIAAIMTAVAAFCRFPDLPRPELRIVFTPDEEIGAGADRIRMDRLGRFGYTVDGGEMGEIETECFHAEEATIVFSGHNVHPGYAKNRMVNAAAIAARLIGDLPEYDVPEHAEGREGFAHLTRLEGDETRAEAVLILRDFDAQGVHRRRRHLELLAETFRNRYPGLGIELTVKEQYRNMEEILRQHPLVVDLGVRAVEMSGVTPIRRAIRGGTDGARLSFMGMPTPNLFAGGMLFHSRKEWIPAQALQKSTETLLHLARLWAEAKGI